MKPTDVCFAGIFLNQRRIWSLTSGSGGNAVYSSTGWTGRMDKYYSCSSCLELESLNEFSVRLPFILPLALSLYVLSLTPSSLYQPSSFFLFSFFLFSFLAYYPSCSLKHLAPGLSTQTVSILFLLHSLLAKTSFSQLLSHSPRCKAHTPSLSRFVQPS